MTAESQPRLPDRPASGPGVAGRRFTLVSEVWGQWRVFVAILASFFLACALGALLLVLLAGGL